MSDKLLSKIFIFDINPGTNYMTNEFVTGKLSKVIKNAANYQYIVIIAHSNLSILINLVKDANIKKGFIVSDNGARIYDIYTKQIIYDSVIPTETVSAIIHNAIMCNALVVLSGNDSEKGYSFDVLNALDLNQKHYTPLSFTNKYTQIERFYKSMNIYSAMVYKKEKSLFMDSRQLFMQTTNDWDYAIHPSLSSFFVLTNKNDSKHTAILKIMEHTKISNNENIYYYSLNAFDECCMRVFRNSKIFQETAFETKFVNKIDTHVTLTSLIEDINKNFFIDLVDDTRSLPKSSTIMNTQKLHQKMMLVEEKND